MDIKYNVVKPNVFLVDDVIYFSLNHDEAIPLARDVDRIVGRNIGGLKVRGGVLEIVNARRALSDEEAEEKNYDEWTTPLLDYLRVLENSRLSGGFGVTDRHCSLLGFGSTLCADTFVRNADISLWKKLKRDLVEPEKLFDKYDDGNPIGKIDKKITLENMQRTYQELDVRMPNDHAHFDLTHFFRLPRIELGIIHLEQVKSNKMDTIDKTRSELIERLKKTEGPSLSFDVPSFYRQMAGVELGNLGNVIDSYGDILFNSEWPSRLFRIDP